MLERCANTEALRRYEDEVVQAELRHERDLEFFHDDIDDLLDKLAGYSFAIHELSKQYETIDREYVVNLIEEATQC